MSLTDQSLVRRVRRWLVRLLAACGLVAALWITRGAALRSAGQWLDVGASRRPADYVLVLNGEHNTRPVVAAGLIHRGLASQALVTSVFSTRGVISRWPSEHELVRGILNHCGIPDERIVVIDAQCRTTADEAEALARFLADRPHATVNIVTNDFHTRRARWIFRQALGKQASRVSVLSAPCDGFSSDNWWRNEDGFVWYSSEFLKLGFYWVRYGSGAWWGLVSFGAVAGVLVMRRVRRRATRNTDADA